MPRYANTPAAKARPSDRFVESPYTRAGVLPAAEFDLGVDLEAGLPIPTIACLSHDVTVEQADPSHAVVRLTENERHGANRDFVLQYCLADFEIQSGTLASVGPDENFFLVTIQPPKIVAPDRVVPREYLFVMDVSGSMDGFPLKKSKLLMKDLIGSLNPEDRFNVVLFAGASKVFAPESVSAAGENLRKALKFVRDQDAGGGTELLQALKKALDLPRFPGYARTVVVATDGGVEVEKETFDLLRSRLGEANLFAFGIGTSVNRYLVEGLAHAGQGEAFIVINPDDAPAQAARFMDAVRAPVLTQVRVDFNGLQVYDVEPPAPGNLLAERPLVILGKWRPPFRGTLTVTGLTPRGPWAQTLDLSRVRPDPVGTALGLLWARKRIALLSDYGSNFSPDSVREEVTRLGLRYGLMTGYTSFVAVDTVVRNPGGLQDTVRQPLPLPDGVTEAAVGSDGGLNMEVA